METNIERIGGQWKVTFKHGNQSFVLDFDGTKKECQWMQKQLNHCFDSAKLDGSALRLTEATAYLKQYDIDIHSRTDQHYLKALEIAAGVSYTRGQENDKK